MKNNCLKERTKDNPYEIWEYNTLSGKWTWNVLKKWQVNDEKPYARWYCFVTSPFCPDGEFGDVYVSEIKECATKIYTDENNL